MPGINQATVGDGYTAKATIQDVFTATGGWFSVSSQPVVLQLQWGPNASGSRWSDEQTLGTGAFGTIPAGCTGIRFRNLVAGSAATVTAYIGSGGPPPDPRGNVWPEPALAISALGSVTTSGKAPTRTIITTAGAGTYNTPSNCVAILVECIGGGGGGGGTPVTAANVSAAGGGGGGGGYASTIIAAPAASYPVTVGAGGTGVNGGTGNAGGNTSFGAGPLVSANGGGGGAGNSIVPPGFVGGAGPGGLGTVGTIIAAGGDGDVGFVLQLTQVYGGRGGAGANGLGAGGYPSVNLTGAGNGGSAPGGGGGGASAGGSQAAQTGGNGGAGQIVVTEFY